MSFCFWLISLRITPSRFICVVAYKTLPSLLRPNHVALYVYNIFYLFTCWWIFQLFHTLPIMNYVAKQIVLQHCNFNFLDMYPEVSGIAEYGGRSIFKFLRKLLFSMVEILFDIPLNKVKVSNWFVSLPISSTTNSGPRISKSRVMSLTIREIQI